VKIGNLNKKPWLLGRFIFRTKLRACPIRRTGVETELRDRKPKTARKGFRRQDFRGEDYGYSK